MALQRINLGTAGNDGSGDAIRTAFQKVNDNFAERLVKRIRSKMIHHHNLVETWM